MKRLLGAYFDKKKAKYIVSVFSLTYFLVTAFWWSAGLARLTIFLFFISVSVSSTNS